MIWKFHSDQGLGNEYEESGRVLTSHGCMKGWVANAQGGRWASRFGYVSQLIQRAKPRGSVLHTRPPGRQALGRGLIRGTEASCGYTGNTCVSQNSPEEQTNRGEVIDKELTRDAGG